MAHIRKLLPVKAGNCNIHPVLYSFYLLLHKNMGAQMVHRRKRKSSTCIEIIFPAGTGIDFIDGHLHTYKEAEKWGFFIICRPQNSPKHAFYHGHRVFLLYLTPVHPKKRRATQPVISSLETAFAAEMAL